MRRWAWALGGGALCALAWVVSCVNNDTTGIPQGADGGPCFMNNTCDPGLVCTTVNGNATCTPGSGDASSDGPGKDGSSGSDAGGDSPTTGDGGASDAMDATVPCFDAGAAVNITSSCTGGSTYWPCYDTVDADQGCWGQGTTGTCPPQAFYASCATSVIKGTTSKYLSQCCLSGASTYASSCGPQIQVNAGAKSYDPVNESLTSCKSGDFMLCDTTHAATCAWAQDAGLVEAGVCVTPFTIDGVPLLNGEYLGICQ